jgi:hypothetical protein
MQSTLTSKNTPVHIKVAYENEFRRFLLDPVSFIQLESTLKTLFNLNAGFRIKFQDDENDWVLLTTDQELEYATELSGTPLRLQVTLTGEPTQPAEIASVGPAVRACRGRGQGRGCPISLEDRLNRKTSRLAARITQLEEKLSSEKLPADRERVLRWRLTMLQEKLAAVKSKQESFANAQPVTEETAAVPEPVSADASANGEEEKPSFRGGRRGRGCGRGGWRRAMMEDGTDQPVRERKCNRKFLAPEIVENFRQCKADLRAARESGDAEKIKSCQENLRLAKVARCEARAALRAQATVDESKL